MRPFERMIDHGVGTLELALLISGSAIAYWIGRRATDSGTSSAATVRNRRLKPDERYLVRLIATHGGRLRQSEIVERLDWSKSKVSRLLSNLEAAGEIEKVDVGRENVVVLEDTETLGETDAP